jgi:hypothetical protein
MNPIEFMKGIKNPKQFVMNMLKQNQNPMATQLMQMVKNGNTNQIEQFARNICKERGMDFDKSFAEFMKQING